MKIFRFIFVVGLIVFIITVSQLVETKAEESPMIEVTLNNTEGIAIGNAILTEKNDGVEIKVEASHLSPGLHGFHIHEHGICELPDFDSAGGHFNPTVKEHGFKNKLGPHAGDLKNLKVEEDGSVKQTFFNDRVTLKKDTPNTLLQGTSLVIHEDKDDYISQPAGNAGERVACGVISSGD